MAQSERRERSKQRPRVKSETGGQGVSTGIGPAGDDAGWRDALHRSAMRVLEGRRDVWAHHALSDDEAEGLVSDLLAYVTAGRIESPEQYSGAEKALLQRLTDLFRQELLSESVDLPGRVLVAGLRSLEGVRAQLEPSWEESLASQLTGANALDLVVEIAHDLRSPLTSVMFLAETLRKGHSGAINEVQRQQLGIIYSAALGLSTMANDLMDSARESDPNGEPAKPEPFSITDVIEAVRVMVAPMAEEKRLDLLFRTPDHDVRVGLVVPLSRVLLNLVTNAIKFTETGSVEILVEELSGNRVEISVLDTGRGIDTSEVERRLYQPFRRSKSQTGFHFSGTGLGLSICARMVKVMGGELQVDSRAGGGTRFFFELNLPRASRI